MTIDERLDRLTERHEALTETVQLTLAEGRTLLKAVSKLARTAEAHERRIERLEKRAR